MCVFINDFRSLVNFNYVISHNQKDFIISSACISRFLNCHSFLSFQHHKVRHKPHYWYFEKKFKTAAAAKLFNQARFLHMVSVCIAFLKYIVALELYSSMSSFCPFWPNDHSRISSTCSMSSASYFDEIYLRFRVWRVLYCIMSSNFRCFCML